MIEPKQCPACCGEGTIEAEEIVGYASRDMAIDGGDRRLEGTPIYGTAQIQCEYCGGNGLVEEG